MVWSGIHHGDRTALVRVNGALNDQIYRDEILQHHVVPLFNVTGGIFSITMPGHTLHESVEIFYSRFIPSKTPLGHPVLRSLSKEPSATNVTGTVLGFTELMKETHIPNATYNILLPACVAVVQL